VGIRPRSKKVDLSVGITPTGGAGYGFREVCFYRDVRTPRLLPDTTGLRWTEAVCGSDPRAPDVLIDTFRLTNTVDSLHLYGVEEDSLGSTAGSYYGFSLTNGCPGILYHAIGQNGAMFANYATGDYVRQLSLLNPSLLIVTLGTNEAYGIRSFREEAFVARMNEFVDLVRTQLPSTAILLTTPAESFRRTRNGFVRNENIARAARAITEYAESGGLACFDLYQATGGANSCREWQNGKLLGRDRIHFTVDGYCEQGKLLYRAIIRLKIERQNHTAS
jgi:lysophospholipase L1-like esterase